MRYSRFHRCISIFLIGSVLSLSGCITLVQDLTVTPLDPHSVSLTESPPNLRVHSSTGGVLLFPNGAVFTADSLHDFVETYGMEIIAGRDFSETFPSDAENAFLINEAAARKLGWEDPLNQQLTLEVWFRGEVQKTGAIIGVLKDFQYNSLHTAIDPLLLHIFPNTYYNDYLSVRLAPDQMEGTLKEMEEACASLP